MLTRCPAAFVMEPNMVKLSSDLCNQPLKCVKKYSFQYKISFFVSLTWALVSMTIYFITHMRIESSHRFKC